MTLIDQFRARAVWLCIAVLLGAFAPGAASREPAKQPSYPQIDSGALTFGSSPKIAWLNNEVLVFVSIARVADPATKQTSVTTSVRKWRANADSPTELLQAFGSNRPEICANEGFLLYSARNKDGSVEAYQANPDEPARQVHYDDFDPVFCRPRKAVAALPGWAKGRVVVLLGKANEGFVDFGEPQGAMANTPIRLYRHGEPQTAGRELPFGRRDIKPQFPYYEFKRAFFVETSGDRYPRPPDVAYRGFWLFSDGAVEKVADVPWGTWRSAGSVRAVPTRAGLVIASSNFNVRNASDLQHAGLYLVTGAGTQRILKTWVGGLRVAVSPDGCRIAYSSGDSADDKNQTLKAMNLCKGSQQ